MIMNIVVYMVAIALGAWLMPGIKFDGLGNLFIAAIVLTLINSFLKPILLFFTFPLSILTLGLFVFILNALLIILASRIFPAFQVSGFFPALGLSFVIMIVSMFLK